MERELPAMLNRKIHAALTEGVGCSVNESPEDRTHNGGKDGVWHKYDMGFKKGCWKNAGRIMAQHNTEK